ncbi:TetR family transcriptional regulator [Streptomyces carminius]|uniref:TetR family transcriptional regulator n=1 Tax=Streptomyces carminius TaxID=2665496 RepID=A0A2M8LTJ8_9ACTN|nr:TetR family transcriptional regulator [Streptomyces carminius]PJE95288.1 TetR family transcriptional regulator [Streptomyces carminius]
MGETSEPGEHEEQRIRRRVSDVAVGLFLERGFEQVTVADVAAAADIPEPALLGHFPAKEDLVTHRLADHEGEAAEVVARRPAECSPLEALRRHFLDGLARRDPATGLNDDPEVLAFHRLLYTTPSLAAHLHAHAERSETALAGVLADVLGGEAAGSAEARVAAGQIVATRRVLARDNRQRIAAGSSAAALHLAATAAARSAFAHLEAGLPRLARTRPQPD